MRRSSPALLSASAARSRVTGCWPLDCVDFFEKRRCGTCADLGEHRGFSNTTRADPSTSRGGIPTLLEKTLWSALAPSADIPRRSSRRIRLLFALERRRGRLYYLKPRSEGSWESVLMRSAPHFISYTCEKRQPSKKKKEARQEAGGGRDFAASWRKHANKRTCRRIRG